LERFKDLRPDIVVTDIKMPMMNGIEMARTIKAINCSTQIIVTSAHGDKPLQDLQMFTPTCFVIYGSYVKCDGCR
jgi:CheY-like chemotaxis protein